MKQALKDQWVGALRSGRYRQCQSRLRDVDDGGWSYCCLGVLCDVVNPMEWEPTGWFRDSSCAAPPDILSIDVQTYLMTLNDDENADFRVIASVVENFVVADDA